MLPNDCSKVTLHRISATLKWDDKETAEVYWLIIVMNKNVLSSCLKVAKGRGTVAPGGTL